MVRSNWVETELGDIFHTASGGTPSRKISDYYSGNIPWVKSGELGKDLINSTEENITEEAIKKSSAKLFPKGTLLIALYGATIGKLGFLNIDATTNQAICGIFTNGLPMKFVYYYLFHKRRDLVKSGIGGAQPNISQMTLKKVAFPIPPLPEQRAIVAKIEQLFSDLDNGIASLKTAQDQLKVYRQAVLKKAFEGELTKDWRDNQTNLPSAEELLGKIKEERTAHYQKQMDEWELAVEVWEKTGKEENKPRKPKKMKELQLLSKDELDKLPLLPLPWKWVKSGELFEYVTSGSRGWAKYYSDSGAVFLRITNLNFDTLELDLSAGKIQYVQLPPNSEGLRTRIKKGDFLFSITGYLGMFAISPDIKEAYVNQHISLARPYQLNNRAFLGYWIISKTGGHFYLNSKSKGAIKAGLGLDDITSFPIPICSLEEQNQIVQEIESRLSVCDKVEETIKESLKKAEALRQSILKKAFEGRLLSEAELVACREEEDWEPAEVLLERIKREKSK